MAASRPVLLVEHDAHLRASLRAALERRGADVIVASDLGDCLARAGEGVAPAVVIVDLRRAGGAAPAFVSALRAEPWLADVPVITMTAEGGARAREDGQAPFDLEDVLAIVLSLCEQQRCA